MDDNVPVGVISSHPELSNLNPADEHTVLRKLADIPEYQTWMKNRLGHLPDVTVTGVAGEDWCGHESMTFDGTYIWVGLDTSPIKILKINPVDNSYTVFTGAAGEEWSGALTFDGIYIWAGLNTSPAKILKINPVDNSYIVITAASGENGCHALTFDGIYIWAGLTTVPAKILKINPVDNSYTVITAASGEDECFAMTFDGTYIWAGLITSPAKILKIFAHRRTMDNISKEYAEAYKFADANKTIIDTVNVFHALQDLTEGLSLGFTWVAGTRGTDITTMATHDGGASTLITTTAAHNLIAGDYITITGTTNYNDSYKVLSAPTGTTFEIDKAWDGNNDATGTYSRGDSYTCDSGSGGVYDFSWNITGEPDAVNKAYSAAIMVNKSPCEKCRAREYFTKAEYETVPGGAIINVSAGDHICIVIKNVSDATDITIRHANFRVERL